MLRPFSFYVKCYTRPSLFAGKLHALLFRKWNKRVKGRDWYDLEWYIKQRIPLDTNHFLQRAIASKGYLEAITWSFTDSKINQLFIESNKEIKIVNPISADLNVLRSSVFSNLIININKNLGRGFKDLSIFEIGPTFSGSKPGEQQTVVSGLRTGKISIRTDVIYFCQKYFLFN